MTLTDFLQLIALILVPAVVLQLELKVKAVRVLGAVVFCYGLGMLAGNIKLFSINPNVSQTVSEVAVPLAIPLLLFSTDIKALFKLASRMLLSFSIMVFCSHCSSLSSIYFFKSEVEEVEKIASMMVGIYTGGTPNLTAIGLALGCRE